MHNHPTHSLALTARRPRRPSAVSLQEQQTPDPLLIETLARREGTPFYLYLEARFRRNLAQFLGIPYAPRAVHFATMANDNPRLLGLLRKAGFGVFVNSLKHLEVALASGFRPDDVIFASTGIPETVMRVLHARGVQVHLDSLEQFERYGRLHPGARVGVRLNIDEKSKNSVFIGAQSRIGLLEGEFDRLLEIAARHRLRLVGTHVYLGTDVTAVGDILAGVEKTLALSARFPDLEFVDLGGGFPIDRGRFDFDVYQRRVAELMEGFSARRGRPIKLILEPGRSVFGDAGFFCTTVTDVKERPGRVLVCCDASASLIPRAMFYEDYNPVRVVGPQRPDHFSKPVDIVGATTYSRDYLAKKLRFPVVRVGDRLLFEHAGSYCYSMITRFLGQALPPEYLLTARGRLELIRTGDRFDSLLKEAV